MKKAIISHWVSFRGALSDISWLQIQPACNAPAIETVGSAEWFNRSMCFSTLRTLTRRGAAVSRTEAGDDGCSANVLA